MYSHVRALRCKKFILLMKIKRRLGKQWTVQIQQLKAQSTAPQRRFFTGVLSFYSHMELPNRLMT